ncbi:MAG TPA: hypothetical protein VFO90_00995 [Terrimicrobiaceae bacterium]|nr:hypothetical protein [Terrimicrobiaceae bacterium]
MLTLSSQTRVNSKRPKSGQISTTIDSAEHKPHRLHNVTAAEARLGVSSDQQSFVHVVVKDSAKCREILTAQEQLRRFP